jgi:hypothetical protein
MMSKIDGGLRKLFIANVPRKVDWLTIETGGTALGVADLNGCSNGVEVWIEMKKADHWAVGNVRTAQVGWIERRVRNGGRCFVAIRRADDEMWLLRPASARLLISGVSLRELPGDLILGRWFGGPNGWDWEKTAVLLGF